MNPFKRQKKNDGTALVKPDPLVGEIVSSVPQENNGNSGFDVLREGILFFRHHPKTAIIAFPIALFMFILWQILKAMMNNPNADVTIIAETDVKRGRQRNRTRTLIRKQRGKSTKG